jgi:hypothetical protein
MRETAGDSLMKAKGAWFIGAGLLSLSVLMPAAQSAEDASQKHKPLMIIRLFTGPDGQTHSEESRPSSPPAAAMTSTS